MKFCQPCPKPYVRRTNVCSRSETVGKSYIFSRKMFVISIKCSYRHVECIWKPRWKKYCKRPKKLRSMSKSVFFKRETFPKSLIFKFFLWTRRKPVWQPRRVFFDKRPTLFCWMSVTDGKQTLFLIQKEPFCVKMSKCTAGPVECSCDYPTEEKINQSPK